MDKGSAWQKYTEKEKRLHFQELQYSGNTGASLFLSDLNRCG